MNGAMYNAHNSVNRLSQILDLSAFCKPFLRSRTEKTIPWKKNMSKIELFGLNEKNITF